MFGCTFLLATLFLQSSLGVGELEQEEAQPRMYLYDYVGNLNPLTWFKRKADKLDAIFEVLECILKEPDLKDCRIVLEEARHNFPQKEKRNETESIEKKPQV